MKFKYQETLRAQVFKGGRWITVKYLETQGHLQQWQELTKNSRLRRRSVYNFQNEYRKEVSIKYIPRGGLKVSW